MTTFAYEMSEASGHHELESFGRAGGITRDHGVLGHDLGDRRDSGIDAFCRDLQLIRRLLT